MSSTESLVYLNGQFLPLSEAKIPVLDRGFLFGDGVYEVIPVYGGHPLRLEEHLRRLKESLASIQMESPLTDAEWADIFDRLITGPADQSIYLQVTRGVAPKRDHAIPPGIKPTLFAMCTPIAPIPLDGIKAVTVDDIRWDRCNIKAITLLANVLLRQEAVENGASEAILVRDNQVLEGAASNIFIVQDGTLITPPKGSEILPGITRDLVLELAHEQGIPAIERHFTLAELKSAEEIWLTSSTREILAVVELDGQPVSSGKPGPLWKILQSAYQDYKQKLRNVSADH
ncbi:MAG: D-amino acid aminotransferase [Methylococcaceae bacterium]|nr:D-amino acid aminotransferase [Methylococcaceae bacterium]